jgi:hypothetical protein
MADNVTFDGFVVDGNNPALAQGGATVIGGINTDSRRAIQTENAAGTAFPANNVTVQFNVIQNFSQRGVELINGTASNTAPATTGNLITRNLIRNFGLDGIVLAFNAYADVTFNTVATNDYPTEAGIWVQDFLNTGTPHTINIANNGVTVGQDNYGGIWINLAYLAAVNINNNTVNAAATVVSGSDYNYGIYLTSLRPGTTMAHLFEEFRRGETLVDDEHIREFCRSLYAQPPIHPEAVREWHNPASLNEDLYELHRLRTIHAHCWTPEEFAVLLAGVVAAGLARWTLRDLYLAEDVGGSEGIEFGFVLGKVAGRGTAGQDGERFLSDWVDFVLADPRRDVQHCVAIGEVIARDFSGQTIFPDILVVPLKRLTARIVALRNGAR